jgi:hypothetical protein
VPSLVAIVGVGRNGSTLLLRLLDGSPQLWLHPVDVVYLGPFDDIARAGRIVGPAGRSATTRPLTALASRAPAGPLVDWFRGHVEELDTLAARDGDPFDGLRNGKVRVEEFLPAFLDAVRRAYRGGPARLLGFKTVEPAYVEDYARVFPDMRFVHIFRHPVQNYASLKRTWLERKRQPFWDSGEDILATFLDARWLAHARAYARLGEREPERHVLVRYEELCLRPREEVTRVAEWLGVDPPPEPELQTLLGGRHVDVLPLSVPSKPGLVSPQAVVADMAAEFGYDEIVSSREAELIWRVLGGPASKLGYRDPPRSSGLVLWLRWLPADASELQNVPLRAWRRWLVEILRRRLFVTRKLLSR